MNRLKKLFRGVSQSGAPARAGVSLKVIKQEVFQKRSMDHWCARESVAIDNILLRGFEG